MVEPVVAAPAVDALVSLVGKDYEVEVGAVAHGGHCVARAEGRVIFVRHALPGERVVARITEGHEASRFLRADAVSVLVAAPDRVKPPCPYAGPNRCGGCDWQHVSLPAQRALKADVVREQLARLAGLEIAVEVEPVDGDVDGLGWRTRVRLAVDRAGRTALRKHHSHELVSIERCLISHELIGSTGAFGGRWLGIDEVEFTVGTSTEERLVQVTSRPAQHAGAAPRLPDLPPDVSVFVDGRKVRGRSGLTERSLFRDYRVAPGGFWQGHPGAADALSDAVVEALAPQPGETALDLFAGVGLFAGALAPLLGDVGAVVAVEGDPQACSDARENLADLTTVRVEHGRVDRVLADHERLGLDSVDLVVLDPPREGARAKVVKQIAALSPRRIAYVACDPAPLARDLATFKELGYELASLRAFDIFPMTQHVECVATLVRVEGLGGGRH